MGNIEDNMKYNIKDKIKDNIENKIKDNLRTMSSQQQDKYQRQHYF